MERHRRFKEKHRLPFPLLADVDKTVTKLYGVHRRWSFGIGPTRRVTFLIDKAGVVQGVFRHELAIDRHRSDVLEGLRVLNEASRSS